MNKPFTIKEILERDGMYVSTAIGDSMWPMLHSKRDVACIVKSDGNLKKHDVALYIRDNGQYVLHRIMKVTDDSYVMCGDGRFVLESGIKPEQVIGVLDSFYRGDKLYTVSCKGYKIYVFIWCLSFSLRKVLMRIIGFIEKKQNIKRNGTK